MRQSVRNFWGLTLMLAGSSVACGSSGSAEGSSATAGAEATGTGALPGTGGIVTGGGGTVGVGGTAGSGGSLVPPSGGGPTGGAPPATGGVSSSSGGSLASGGTQSSGGSATGGVSAGGSGSGGASTGGDSPSGGAETGGAPSGGAPSGGAEIGGAPSGGAETGGAPSGGAETGGAETGGSSAVDCAAPMPANGVPHCGSNTQGNAGGLSWSLWSNAVNSNSCITTYDSMAFSASWVESGDFLARIGLEFGGAGKPYTEYGTIKADFSYTKTGTGGGFSYIGMYGWSNNPCVEYYIVEDSYNNFPFNAWNASHEGTANIDGEDYKLFRNLTNGTGGSRCSGVSQWDQFWSIRQSARQCGTISVSEHFDAWADVGMNMGTMLEVKILVEVGGGSGSIDFPVAVVTAE